MRPLRCAALRFPALRLSHLCDQSPIVIGYLLLSEELPEECQAVVPLLFAEAVMSIFDSMAHRLRFLPLLARLQA